MPRRRALYALLALLILGIALAWLLAGTGRERAPRRAPTASATRPAMRPATALPPSSTPAPTPTPTPALSERLRQNPMPPLDYVAFVSGLQGQTEPIPRIVRTTPVAYQPGDQQVFWIGDVEGDEARSFQITATLWVQLEHVQMWVEEGVTVERAALERSAQVFEQQIYPTNRRYFGSEWTPGVDGDPHLVVLNAVFRGAAGYFASANEYPRAANPYSNEREMFVMNIGVLTPGTAPYDSTLAHEFQHMILWHQDLNEDAWVSEGASQLAEDLNGFSAQGVAQRLAQLPDTQLNTWADEHVGAHYGGAYLMLRYFLNRTDEATLRALIQEPQNGAAGFDAVLAARAGARGSPMTFDDLFADWLVANGLDDPGVAGGRYGYAQVDLRAAAEPVSLYPYMQTTTVQQYAADYYDLTPTTPGTLRVTFSGTSQVKLVPNDPASGRFQWWSNRGDSGHSFLERRFDLTQATTATLSANLWYDIENGWDYAYVRVSTDEGKTWQFLRGAHMSDYNPVGNALGPGYTGQSGAAGPEAVAPATWVRETFDLGPYLGHAILIRFDYVTDEAVNHAGLCLDDLQLEAVGFYDDVEAGEEGWHAEGFIRHENVLPQRYRVQAVEFAPDARVRQLPVDAKGQGSWVFAGFGGELKRVLLIISAMTPATTEAAEYQLRIEQTVE